MKKWIPVLVAVVFAAAMGFAGPGLSGGGSAGLPLSGGTLTGPLAVPMLDAGVFNCEGSATLGRAGGTVSLGIKGSTSTVSLGADTINIEGNSVNCVNNSPGPTECSGFSTKTGSTAGYTANTTANNKALAVSVEGARVATGPDTYFFEKGTRAQLFAGVDGTPGAGGTINQTSALGHQIHRYTVDNTVLTAAASTDITIWTTPVNTRIIRIIALVTAVFAGGSLSAVTLTCGNAAGGSQYLNSTSVLAATTTIGDVAAEIGAALLDATRADMGTPAGGIPGAIAISCRFTCTGANCNAATTGSVSFEIEHVVYP